MTTVNYSTRVEVTDAAVLAAIDGAIRLLEDPRDLLQEIGDQLEANVALRFETKTDPAGQKWAPLSEATKEIYQSDWFIKRNPAFKGGIPGSLLQRTNAMRQSLAFNVVDNVLELGFSRATKGGRWEVSQLHETGTRNMPRRGILTADPTTGELGAQDQAAILAIVNGQLGALFG